MAEQRTAPVAASWWGDVFGDDSRLAIALHYLSLPIVFVVLAYQMRRQWFFSDDFQVLAVTSGEGARGLFRPFAEHWLTAPKLLADMNFAVFGFRNYWPTILVVLGLHLVVAHLVWRLLRQIGVATWIATGLSAAYAVSCGNSVTFGILQAGWFGAIGVGIVVIMLANHDGRETRRDAVGVGLAVVNLAVHSGVAIAMLVPATLVALLRRGWRGALEQSGPPAIVYGVWLLVIGRDRPFEVAPQIPRGEVPRFVVTEFVGGVEDVTPLFGPLPVLAVVALGAWLVWRARSARTDRAPTWAMAVGAVTVYVVIALGRGKIAYRYSYLEWLLLLPSVGLLLHEIGRKPRGRAVLGIAVGVALGLTGLYRFNEVVHAQRVNKQDAKHFILGAAALTETVEYVPDVIVRNEAAPITRARHLAEWHRDGKFPAPGPQSAGDLREITPHLQVRYVRKPPTNFLDDPRPEVSEVLGAEAEDRRDCVVVQPSARRREVGIVVRARASISVAGVDRVLVRLPSIGAGGEEASSGHSVPPDKPEYLEFATGTRPTLVLPPEGTAEVCGVQAGFVDPSDAGDVSR